MTEQQLFCSLRKEPGRSGVCVTKRARKRRLLPERGPTTECRNEMLAARRTAGVSGLPLAHYVPLVDACSERASERAFAVTRRLLAPPAGLKVIDTEG